MKLTPKHYEAFCEMLNHPGETIAAMSERLNVPRRTLANWRMDPDFMAAFRDTAKKWNEDMSDIYLAHKRNRVLSAQTIHDTTDDPYVKLAALKAIREEIEPKLLRGIGKERAADGSERTIVFEVGVAPGTQEDGLPPEIPWGDGSLELPLKNSNKEKL